MQKQLFGATNMYSMYTAHKYSIAWLFKINIIGEIICSFVEENSVY